MKQTKIFAMVLMAAALLTTSCASKKDLQNCQTENRELTANYQDTKEKLAATEASLAAAQQQLATAKSDYAKLQSALDKSLTMLIRTILASRSSLTRSMRATSTSVTWLR